MKTTGLYAAKILRFEEETYAVVVLPISYADCAASDRYYIIYIVPNTLTYDLNLLWQRFILQPDNNIHRLILTTRKVRIKLTVPKLSCLCYSDVLVDNQDLFKKITKEFTMILDISEGIYSTNRFERLSGKFKRNKYIITADKPYIAFIYDNIRNEIIISVKDTGKIKKTLI